MRLKALPRYHFEPQRRAPIFASLRCELWTTRLDRIPSADPLPASLELTPIVEELLALQLEPGLKLTLARAALRCAEPVIDGLLSRHAREGLPLAPQPATFAESAALLARYLLALIEQCASPALDRLQSAEQAYLDLKARQQLLLCAGQLYQRPPEGLWVDAHRVLAQTAARRLLHLALTDDSTPTGFGDVLSAYRGLLLLGAIDFSAYDRTEQLALAEAVSNWAGDVHFLGHRRVEPGPQHYRFTPTVDGPPLPHLRPLDPDDDQTQLFEVEALATRLTRGLMRSGDEYRPEVAFGLQYRTLKRLIRQLSQGRQRRTARLEGGYPVPVIFGMKQVLGCLRGGHGELLREGIPMWVENHAEGGVQLRCPLHTGISFRVGDLALSEDRFGQSLMLAIRWVAEREDDALAVGCEALTVRPQAAMVRARSMQLAAIWCDASGGRGVDTLLLEHPVLREGENIEVVEGGRSHGHRLGLLDDATLGFWRYRLG